MHTHIFFKEDTTKPIVWKEKKSPHPGEARRDEAPVSSVVPATTEKHQETTTQLSTPSLFNYCHIITAITFTCCTATKQTHTEAQAHIQRRFPLTNASRDTAASQRLTRLASFYTSLMWSSSGGIRRLTSIKQTRRTTAENNLSEMLIH